MDLLTKRPSIAIYVAVEAKISAFLAFPKRLTVAANIDVSNYHPTLRAFSGLFELLLVLQLRHSVRRH
jgi:hypothetical protein